MEETNRFALDTFPDQSNEIKYKSIPQESTNKRARLLYEQHRPKIDEKFAKSGRLAVAHKVSGVNHSVLWWCAFANL